MNKALEKFYPWILKTTGATEVIAQEHVQALWSDYGEISRLKLKGGESKSIIAKHIALPKVIQHPRGWNTASSHKRKQQSYVVENHWYIHWSDTCKSAKIPNFIGFKEQDTEQLIVLEDLNQLGFTEKKQQLKPDEAKVVLQWLANFHGQYINQKPEGLWEIGTYWHLETRNEEWQKMPDSEPLKEHAEEIDALLKASKYQTIVHGDAKVANFCFSADLKSVAAVDFQYVGQGSGIKDVAYFLGSCLDSKACFEYEKELLDYYFKELSIAINTFHPTLDTNKVEEVYRLLYKHAWADFIRFLIGWSPNHHKMTPYAQQMCKQSLAALA